jgi:membrane-bound lytic murein transglycosylase MltF
MSPEELLMWEELYHTVVDCYKIAIGHWKHFVQMRWHAQTDAENILCTARQHLEEWINSADFAANLKYMGFEPERAVTGVRKLLAGDKRALETVRPMLKHIAKERDARRNREVVK